MSSSNEAYFRTQILLLTILWFTLENHIHVRPCTTWHMLKRFENKSEQTKCGQYATRPRKVNLLKEFLFETFFFQLWLQKSDNLQHNTLVCFSKVCWQRPAMFLPLHLKQTFPPIIWIFSKGEVDGIKTRRPFKIFSTLYKTDLMP